MEVVYKKSWHDAAKIINIDDSLGAMRDLVGGTLGCIEVEQEISLWHNDEGKLLRLQPNVALAYEEEIFDIVFGPIFMCELDEEGKSISISEEKEKFLLNTLNGDSGAIHKDCSLPILYV